MCRCMIEPLLQRLRPSVITWYWDWQICITRSFEPMSHSNFDFSDGVKRASAVCRARLEVWNVCNPTVVSIRPEHVYVIAVLHVASIRLVELNSLRVDFSKRAQRINRNRIEFGSVYAECFLYNIEQFP